jgi:hypothetical protein
MGGADFVQWHGNYELLHYTVRLQKMADELRAAKGKPAEASAEPTPAPPVAPKSPAAPKPPAAPKLPPVQ